MAAHTPKSIQATMVIFLAFLLPSLVLADVIVYNNHYLKPETPEYLIIPKYSKQEVPHWSPGKGRSFIDLSRLTVRSACYVDENAYPRPAPPSYSFDKDACQESAKLDMLMFEAPMDKPWMDYWHDGEFCCTQRLIEEGGCPNSQKNSLIVPGDLPSAFLRSTFVSPDEPAVLFQGVGFQIGLIHLSEPCTNVCGLF